MKLILCSHGRLASGFESAIQLLLGSGVKIECFDSYIDGLDIRRELLQYPFDKAQEYLIMCDLLDGSVSQEVLKYVNQYNIHVVSGVNLAFVLEVILRNQEGTLTSVSIPNIVKDARLQMVYVNEELNKVENKNNREGEWK